MPDDPTGQHALPIRAKLFILCFGLENLILNVRESVRNEVRSGSTECAKMRQGVPSFHALCGVSVSHDFLQCLFRVREGRLKLVHAVREGVALS